MMNLRSSRRLRICLLAACFLLVALLGAGLSNQGAGGWKDDWEVAAGFSLSIDSEGFDWPTALAFVPEPGPGPKDPLYFVTELRGMIKVVTNDRTVHTFADNFFKLNFPPPVTETLNKLQQEIGMAAIHLEPNKGYLFVSFTYHDEQDRLRNNIARFQCKPGTFSLKPSDQRTFTDVFARHPADAAHMVGGMAVMDGHLYVGVGDAEFPQLARNLNSPLGKVLRMTLDGDPLPDNPFFEDGDRANIKNYVWAFGFRNPFGVTAVQGELFVTDNGPASDRFVRIRKGGDYAYDGSEWSIGSHADVVFAPAVSPVQMAYAPKGYTRLPEEYQGKFFVALSGNIWHEGPGDAGQKSYVTIDYDFENKRVVGRPRQVVRFAGVGKQMPVGIALGPDALYLVLMYGLKQGTPASILKLAWDPEHAHPAVLGRSAGSLITSFGCLSCHRDAPGAIAKPINDSEELTARILERLGEPQYNTLSLELDKREDEPYKSFRAARKDVREQTGIEKVKVWLESRLMQPKFDMPDAQMPTFDLTHDQARSITRSLLFENRVPKPSLTARLTRLAHHYLPNPAHRYVLAFLAGTLVAMVGVLGIAHVRRWRRRRMQPKQQA